MGFPIDLNFLRENKELYREVFRKRGLDESKVDIAIELDNKRKELQRDVDKLKNKKNILSKLYGFALRYLNNNISKEDFIKNAINLGYDIHEGNIDREFLNKLQEDIKNIDVDISKLEETYKNTEDNLIDLLWSFPNILSSEVPIGDESLNTPIRFWGVPRVYDIDLFKEQTEKFGWKIIELNELAERYIKNKELLNEINKILEDKEDFKEISFNDIIDFEKLNQDKIVVYKKIDHELKHQYDILRDFNLADTDIAGEVAGSRFYYEFNILSLLDLALSMEGIKYMINKGYKFTIPPYMLKRDVLDGIITLDDFADMMYKIDGEDLYLIGTAEHPITALYYNTIIEEKDLPIKIIGWSPCFRKEAGSHGKDTKGLFRLHQFHKVEQYIFCKPEDSEKYHQELINNSEEFFEKLNIPYRRIIIASKDMGKRNYKQYDIEGWFPGQQKYRELVSGSNVTDWQSRRSNIRYRKKDNDLDYVHTLNCTLTALQRTITCILENNYDYKNNRILIPKLLQSYVEKEFITK
ncbi:serine--tRNA ligase [Nanobdella aerobiophila]|uniref:Serine--tRNA ligase n=1 Tax=Nanobdella aerobiophila TaxID=2586965 RepID=A0A915WRR5_9ARCH|nr:serine--tRNA ligase [Nanobdella aerobiophila]BBL45504.1 serine--tRNA ligase [Nanobdella aerobiophila]